MTTPASAASAAASAAAASTAQGQVVAALQAVLAAEQAVSYGYGIVGAHLPQGSALQTRAGNYWLVHLRLRDKLSALIRARGGQPVPAAVAYELPLHVQSAAEARTLAALLEDRVAQAYLSMVVLPEEGLRSFAALQVRAAALRAEAWRGSTRAFPGLPGSSLRGAGA
jgi:Domain of unknown function (DUF4439)